MCQTPTEIIIKTMVAGVRPEDLDIAITRDMVTVRGRREEEYESKDNDFFHKELYWGSFSRTIILPVEIEIEEAEASEKHGLLTIILPKVDKNRQSKLKVKAN
jgi:HSP20 family protein